MNREWSLKELYEGYDDPKFQEDFAKLGALMEEYKEKIAGLDLANAAEGIHAVMLAWENMRTVSGTLGSYCSLRQSVNTTEAEAAAYMGKLQGMMSNTTKAKTAFKKFVASLPDLEGVISSDELLAEYKYLLLDIKKSAGHLLGEEAEEAAAKLNMSGGTAWEDLQSYLTSTVKVDYEGGQTTLSAIRNLAYSKDAAIRKSAYEAELASYEKIKDAVAFSLNSIKKEVLTMVELRGYESPLDMALQGADMKAETLEAMFTAMREYFPKFHQYLKRKGELLGHKNGLPWYDMFAPMGKVEKSFTAEEARDYLIHLFEGFAPDLADMAKRAFDEAWIDFYPHEGKVGGAFCASVRSIQQSRILTNFDNSLSDVVTLAHELGHAYHNMQIYSHRPCNTGYSMPVAETASTFNEAVVMDAAIAAAEGEERAALIESQLQDVTQIICDIYSRYLFESAVFEKRNDSFLFADQLKEIMLSAQEQAYGNGLDHSLLHPYMWVCKSHYYSTGLSYYNFPYAFGGLFARGLYAMYKEEGEAFLPKYRALLHATPVNSVEDAALVAGIDLTSPDFFRRSLQSYAERIDEFLELTK